MYNAKIKFLYKTMNWTMCARTIALTQTVHFYETTWIPVHWYYYLQHKNIQDDSDTIRVWYIHHHICKHWLFLELSSCKYLDKVSILLRSLLIIGSKSNKAPDVSSRISATSLFGKDIILYPLDWCMMAALSQPTPRTLFLNRA